jgi:flagellar assembly protein FliH
MGTILKKERADEFVLKHKPKGFVFEVSQTAKNFVRIQAENPTHFEIAEVVAKQSGIRDMRKKETEAQVEETVLERLKEIQEEAYQKAYDIGLVEGQNKAFEERRSEFVEKLTILDSLYSAVDENALRFTKENEVLIVKLVFEVAKRLALREIKLDQSVVTETIYGLSRELHEATKVVIKLSPRDFQFVEELRTKKVKEMEPLAHVKIEPEDTVKDGGCLIETNYGAIDATIEQRVERAWSVLQSKMPAFAEEQEKHAAKYSVAVEKKPEDATDGSDAEKKSDDDKNDPNKKS